jgi:hypothetical protein
VHDYSSAYRGEFSGGSGGLRSSSSRASTARRGKRRLDDDEPTTAKRARQRRALPPIQEFDATDGLPDGDRWSTWDSPIPFFRAGGAAGQGRVCLADRGTENIRVRCTQVRVPARVPRGVPVLVEHIPDLPSGILVLKFLPCPV